MTADDKRLFRSLEQQHADSALSRSNSVDTGVSPSSPFGDLGDHQTRKKLVHLIATLNASYPDYDFSSAKAESFTWKTGAEYMHMVKNSIMTTLAEADTSLGSSVNLCEQLWQQIESEISPSECDIFSYIPDMDCDPLSDGKMCAPRASTGASIARRCKDCGLLATDCARPVARGRHRRAAPPSSSWSFNYFFYNHRMKKVLFFTCSCTRISTSFGVATDSHRRADGTADDEEDMFAFEDLEPADL
eukprot:CAMPEP_0119406836 /NCGR_PEP_ID=MMETSP1335-20130426/1009_1 /TAXON_ID=259385 /ORGANISM="Chrysoculter rhomboideus, Strain RCC1486" /LENGTH=245 /DNA_ID=CAMNT_0007430929 /DNA_START=12 /DNA_END=749 /DNA_ORIENTATION=-